MMVSLWGVVSAVAFFPQSAIAQQRAEIATANPTMSANSDVARAQDLAPFGGQVKHPLQIEVQKDFDLSTPGSAVAVAWSPDGSALAAASSFGGTLTVWSSSGHLINQFQKVGGGPNLGGSIAFFKGSSELLFQPPQDAPVNAALSIWDIASGKIVGNVPGPVPGNSYAHNSADHFQISSDQRILVAGMRSNQKSVVTFRTDDWGVLNTFSRTQGVFCLSLFGSDRLAAIGSIRGQVEILDLRTGEQVTKLHAYTQSAFGEFPVEATAGSPDGAFVLTGLGLGGVEGPYVNSPEAARWVQSQPTVKVFRVADSLAVASLAGPTWPIRQAMWDPKGRYVALLDDSGYVYLWQPLASPDSSKRFYAGRGLSLSLAPDGRHIAVTTDEGVSVFQLNFN